jgi:glyoxylase-like metal-dependent hydrolase (beta-lactamase superfamily II)
MRNAGPRKREPQAPKAGNDPVCPSVLALSMQIAPARLSTVALPHTSGAVGDPEPQVRGADRLPEGIERIRAPNPGPLSLSGTNTYLLGSPAWVIDPGPDLEEHLERVLRAAQARRGIAGIALTHRHQDHAEGAAALRERSGAPLAASPEPDTQPDAIEREKEAAAALESSGAVIGSFREPVSHVEADVTLREGDSFGPLRVLETPGHSADHLCFLAGTVLFTGDTILGEGSVIVPPFGGSLRSYLASLQKLERLELTALCPGHGPVVWEARAKIAEYIDHRLDRERRLVAALEQGLRRREDLLDQVWDDVPAVLRPAAALTLETHLDKLAAEGRLPSDVEAV